MHQVVQVEGQPGHTRGGADAHRGADRRQRQAGTASDPDGWRATAQVYAAYQRTLIDANAADFGDLLLWPATAMLRDAAYRERWSKRFDCLLADEYQDVNQAQYTWLRLFGARHGEVFVVGDDDQSVFGFRGAEIAFIQRFTKNFPGAAQIRLEENFRSTGRTSSRPPTPSSPMTRNGLERPCSRASRRATSWRC